MNKHKKVCPAFILTALLSSVLTIITSIVYIVLCTLALILRFNCSFGQLGDATGAQYFITTLFRVYIQNSECENALRYSGLTQSYSVFIFAAIILSFAAVSLFFAIALAFVANSENGAQNIHIYSCVHIGIQIAVIVVDLTLGVHFGIDHNTLSEELSLSSPGLGMNYEKEMIRLGALLLMTISLKGYCIHAINIVLLVLLAVYGAKHKQSSQNEHSIYTMGALNAYEEPRMNNTFPYDAPRRLPMRENPIADMNNGNSIPHDRSNSWHHSQPGPGLASRQFIYPEEQKRPATMELPPAPRSNWRRDNWNPSPAIPEPDYSPPMRLKSAMRSNY